MEMCSARPTRAASQLTNSSESCPWWRPWMSMRRQSSLPGPHSARHRWHTITSVRTLQEAQRAVPFHYCAAQTTLSLIHSNFWQLTD